MFPAPEQERGINPYSLDQFIYDYNNSFNGIRYGTLVGSSENISDTFEGFIQGAVKTDGVVFGCMLARLSVFSDVRFQFREMRNGTPGDLVGNPDGRNPASSGLRLLQKPWQGGTSGDLLARMIQDADVAGNAFIARRATQLVRLRPDWVTIVAGVPGDREASLWHPDAQVLGYIYKPGGYATDDEFVSFDVDEVAHFAPTPDPQQRFRGISWLEPVLTEILSDKAMTLHKKKFFDNGATVNLILEYPDTIRPEVFQEAVEAFKNQHEGIANAYKTLHAFGATAKPVGATLEQADFKTVQGHGETRIAVAAGVPPIIVGLSEGLESATYSNYGQARRAFADRTIRPLWRNACASLSQIIPAPPVAELWYDDTDVAFIREDQADAANIREIDARANKALIEAGWEADSIVDYLTSGDMKRLKHTGLFSVQLQAPGSTKMPQGEAPGEKPVAGGTPGEPPVNPAKNPAPAPAAQNGMRDFEVDYWRTQAMSAEARAVVLAAISDRQQPDVTPITIHNHQPEVKLGATEITVQNPTPEVRVDVPPAEVNVTVEGAEVNVEPTPIEVRVDAPVSVEPTPVEVRVDAPVTVEPTPIEVTVPSAEVNVSVEPTPLEVRVDAPVTVEPTEVNITVPKTRKKLLRDEQGRPSGVEEEPITDEGSE